MKTLRTLPQDVTFVQSELPKLIQGLGNNLYSADMTAFTDVFPIELVRTVVDTAYDAAIGSN
jgi:hypothetical protein